MSDDKYKRLEDLENELFVLRLIPMVTQELNKRIIQVQEEIGALQREIQFLEGWGLDLKQYFVISANDDDVVLLDRTINQRYSVPISTSRKDLQVLISGINRGVRVLTNYGINTDLYMVIWGNENQFVVIDRNNIQRQYRIDRWASDKQVRRTLGLA